MTNIFVWSCIVAIFKKNLFMRSQKPLKYKKGALTVLVELITRTIVTDFVGKLILCDNVIVFLCWV